jgi:signal transduction histidine kinase
MSPSRFVSLSFILLVLFLKGKISRDDPADDTLHVVHQALPVAHDAMDPLVLAHELSAPVSALNVLTDMLADRNLADDVHQEIASAIKGELRILRSLIADVEELASPAARPFAVLLRPTPIGDLFRQAALYVRTINPDADIRIDCAPDLYAMADAQRIEQVLRNLVGNAVRYTSPGAPIELRASRAQGRVRIEVIDQGPGIPTRLLPLIFDKRIRGPQHGLRPVPGKGFGLYICREIVEAHGSRLDVRSSVKKGTTFSFELRGANDQPAHR